MRTLIPLLLALSLVLATVAFAQEDNPAAQPADQPPTDLQPPTDQQPSDQTPGDLQPAPDQSSEDQGQPTDQQPSGPVLQPANAAPILCSPGATRLRYLEVRGSGFQAWANQRLSATLVDANGTPQVQWPSIFVASNGDLRVEVNLCADPFRQRPALPAGTYGVNVATPSGTIFSTSFDVVSPPEGAESATTPQEVQPAGTSTAIPLIVPGAPATATPASTPTPFPTFTLPVLPNAMPLASPTPRTGPGSQNQPLPLGAPGVLADGWQTIVTGVSPDAWDGIKAATFNTQPPASDQRDVMIGLQGTYQGSTSGVFSGVRFALITPDGTVYDQIKNSCGVIPNPIPPNLMTPGGSVRGNVCFTVRATDVPNLVLFDNQATANDRIYFLLH